MDSTMDTDKEINSWAMDNMCDSNETENAELFENLDAEDSLEIQIRKLQKIKDTLRNITTTHAVMKHDAKDIIQKIERDLIIDYDTTFLNDYHNVLKSNNTVLIKQINNTIFSSIERALKRQRIQKKPFEEAEVVLMAAWLSVAALCGARPALATRTLQALLAAAQDETIERIALMWQRTATAEMLLELSDATSASPDHESSALADMLLRGALLATTTAPRAEATGWDKLQPHEIVHALDAKCTDESLSVLFRIAARVLADKRSDSLMASVERAAVVARVRARAHARARAATLVHGSNRIQVTAPTTLRMLFGKKKFPVKQGAKRKVEHTSN